MREIQARRVAAHVVADVSDGDFAFGRDSCTLLRVVEAAAAEAGHDRQRGRGRSRVQRQVDSGISPSRSGEDPAAAALEPGAQPRTSQRRAHSVVRLVSDRREERREHRMGVDEGAPRLAIEHAQDPAGEISRVDDREREHQLVGGEKQGLPALLDHAFLEEAPVPFPGEPRKARIADRT